MYDPSIREIRETVEPENHKCPGDLPRFSESRGPTRSNTRHFSRPFAQGTRRLLYVLSCLLQFLDGRILPLRLISPPQNLGKAVACVFGNHCLFPTKRNQIPRGAIVGPPCPRPSSASLPALHSNNPYPSGPIYFNRKRLLEYPSLSMRLVRHCRRPTPLP